MVTRLSRALASLAVLAGGGAVAVAQHEAAAERPAPAVYRQEARVAPVLLTAAQEEKKDDPESRLLPLGQVAPDFTLPQVGGGEFTLSTNLSFYKAFVVMFWATDAKAGGEDIHKVQKLYNDLAGSGFSAIGVNPRDADAEKVQKLVMDNEISFPLAIDGKATNSAVTGVYRARTLPTVYVLDPEGKVLYRSIGYKEETLLAALEKAGVKKDQ